MTKIMVSDPAAYDMIASGQVVLPEGVELLLANVRAPIRDLLERSGVAQTIGEEHIYPSIEEGVKGFRAQFPAQDRQRDDTTG